jgi:hypothetical protein
MADISSPITRNDTIFSPLNIPLLTAQGTKARTILARLPGLFFKGILPGGWVITADELQHIVVGVKKK